MRLSAGVLLALMAAAPALAQGEAASAGVAAGRVFVDTTVREVVVDDAVTTVVMSPSPQSPCPSDRYVFERERPKWLNTTGRIMEAQREGAVLRISFSCIRGYQSINAIQFLSPPSAPGTPRREQARASPGIAVSPPGGAPATAEGLRAVPLPREAAAPGPATAPLPGASSSQGGVPVPLDDTGAYVTERMRAIPQP